ncbi:hypothetical protein BGZ97_004203 [Linnemannia gamsii]|uniref:FHA domain-containing protein n=1 Tax=Linnemannia gamsii TaxID=64522 RepID=A0A9P6UH61_9FUNG|nr:hypothetical protein BGZ97_004203 [Linnemannia gamsii]
MAPVVATLTLSESGQSENLLQDTTLILGRHTFEGVKSPHISRKQGKLQLTSKGDEITITNLGTNRSSLNRTALSNDTPTKVKDGDKITLIEDKFEVCVHVLKRDLSTAQDTSIKKESLAGSSSNTGGGSERPKANSPAASRSPVAGTAIDAEASTATAAGLTNSVLTRDQDLPNIQHTIKDTALRMEIVDDSENTSDSDKEDAMDVDARSSDISAESSFVCEDLTDSGNDSDSDNGR